MIEPQIKPDAIESEVKTFEGTRKQEYIDFEELSGDEQGGPEFETEEEFERHQEAASAPSDRFYKSGKLAFTLTDAAIPRIGAYFTGQSHKDLQAAPEDKEDIIRAYEAVFEYYDYNFDNPVAALALILFLTYGLKIIEGVQKKPKKAYTPPIAPIEVDQEEFEDEEEEEAPPPGTKSTVNDGVLADFPTCTAHDCAKILKPGQVKFCSNECRMKGLNAKGTKKEEKDDGEKS